VRLDALGDTLLSTPALQVLREQWPEAQLLALTHPAGSQVLRPLCQVEEVSPASGWRQLAQVLRQFQPQAVLCFSEKRRAALASWASGAPLRIGFDPGKKQPLKSLANRLFFQRSWPANDPALHEAERYLKLVELLLEQTGLEAPPLQLEPLPEHRQKTSSVSPALGIQLTPKWCRFGYTVAHLRHWISQLPGPQLGLAGPTEWEWAQSHFGHLPLYCSQDLFEYAAVLERLPVLVTIDTGAAHVAAARGCPVVDVFPEEGAEHCVPRWRAWCCPHEVVLLPKLVAADLVGEQLRGAVSRLWKAPA